MKLIALHTSEDPNAPLLFINIDHIVSLEGKKGEPLFYEGTNTVIALVNDYTYRVVETVDEILAKLPEGSIDL